MRIIGQIINNNGSYRLICGDDKESV